MRNLLSNAAKYSAAGSTVRAIVDETDEGVRVRVLDEGVGIDANETARLFELYYRSPLDRGQGRRRGHRPVRVSRAGRGDGRPDLGRGATGGWC